VPSSLLPNLHASDSPHNSRAEAAAAVRYLNGTVLDDRAIRVDYDWGFVDGRQWGRGKSGGQVRGLTALWDMHYGDGGDDGSGGGGDDDDVVVVVLVLVVEMTMSQCW